MRIAQQQLIQLESIDQSHNWSLCPLTNSGQLDRLHRSIKQTGIVQPPILQQISKKRFRLINGRKRVQIARQNNLNPLHCHILDKNLPIQQILAIHLTEQQLSGALTTIEQAYFLQLCLQFTEKENVINTFLPLLGYSSQPIVINRLLAFLRLEDKVQLLFHEQFIGKKTATILLELDQSDRIFLTDLFVELKLGQGKQQRLLTLCQDLSRRHNSSIKTILSDRQVKKNLQHQGMNTPQKTNQLLELLKKQHSPKYYEAKEDFQHQRNQFDLPDHCSLNHSPAFEKDEVILSIKFSNLDECKKTWQTIHKPLKEKN